MAFSDIVMPVKTLDVTTLESDESWAESPNVESAAYMASAERAIADIVRHCVLDPLVYALFDALLDRAILARSAATFQPQELLSALRTALREADLSSALDRPMMDMMVDFAHDGCFESGLNSIAAREEILKPLKRVVDSVRPGHGIRAALTNRMRVIADAIAWDDLLSQRLGDCAPDNEPLAALGQEVKTLLAVADIRAFLERQSVFDSDWYVWLLIRFDSRLAESFQMRTPEARRRQALIDSLADMPLE